MKTFLGFHTIKAITALIGADWGCQTLGQTVHKITVGATGPATSPTAPPSRPSVPAPPTSAGDPGSPSSPSTPVPTTPLTATPTQMARPNFAPYHCRPNSPALAL